MAPRIRWHATANANSQKSFGVRESDACVRSRHCCLVLAAPKLSLSSIMSPRSPQPATRSNITETATRRKRAITNARRKGYCSHRRLPAIAADRLRKGRKTVPKQSEFVGIPRELRTQVPLRMPLRDRARHRAQRPRLTLSSALQTHAEPNSMRSRSAKR